MRPTKRWLWLLLLIPLGAILAFGGYVVSGSNRNAPMPEALAALVSDDQVTVTTGDWLVFTPAGTTPTTALLIYPGGLVPPEAYAPTARDIAAQGYLAVIVPMPLNLAVFAPGRGADVIAAYPNISHWAVAGHSLGGSMAAQFAHDNPDTIAGLILWASYPAGNLDLSPLTLAAQSVYGTKDGVAALADVLDGANRLPPNTEFIPIEGGNHTQFGYYGTGLQQGDNPAGISRAEQQAQMVSHAITLLASLSE